jgi:hypothetical protein
MTTNVLLAANVAGVPVVSIFSNPDSEAGQDNPVYDRFNYLDRIHFDSRFDYLSVAWRTDIVIPFDPVAANTKEEKVSTIAIHNFGFPPASILVDTDTREIIANNNFIQIQNYTSYRTLSFLMDNSRFYIKENRSTKETPLAPITRRYTILAFSNSAATS